LTVAGVDVLPAGGRIQIDLASRRRCDNAAQHDGIALGRTAISLTATGWGIDDRKREWLFAGQARAEDVSRAPSAVRAVGQAGGGLRLDSVSGDR
jgi:hypothetical protein